MNDDGTITSLAANMQALTVMRQESRLSQILMHRAISVVSKILHMRLVPMTDVRQR